ncbi:MAG: hypothetical protein IPM56_10555 [Ignavibacteriales bacterium]|nr:MAG: hypothetical protein IPM56_10555 [Ignavibacteriales bacterium]
MKKYLLILLPVLFFGCEKDFDGSIQPQNMTYRIIQTSSFDKFDYTDTDSTITLFIKIDSSSSFSNMYCDVYSSEDKKLNASAISLLDNGNISNGDTTAGDFIFSNNFVLSINYPNGRYSIKYFIVDNNNETSLAAVQTFTYDNGKSKIAPLLSNLQIPDSVNRNQSFVFSVFTSDSNGLNDVEIVYFELFRPDGSQVEINPDNKFIMHDDGDLAVWGDETAGDGRYSYRNSFSNTAQLGSWRFEFEARDKSNKLSNRLIHFLVVK